MSATSRAVDSPFAGAGAARDTVEHERGATSSNGLRRPKTKRPKATQQLVSYAILALFAVFYVWPLLILVFTSFKTRPEFRKNKIGLPENFGFSNYVNAWREANFSGYLFNSLTYTVIATALFVLMTVFVAFPIARGYIRGAKHLLLLYVVALFLPPALIPQFQLILNLNLYNTRLGYIMLFLINPIGLIIMVNFIKSVPRELDEAAAMDGCGYFRFVFSVVMPLIKPAIATVTVIHAINIWNELVLATIYLNDDSKFPITRGLIAFESVYGGKDLPSLAAAVLMMMVPMLVLFMFLQRFIISGLTAGAVKG